MERIIPTGWVTGNEIAVAVAVIVAPMLLELLVSVIGNLRRFSTPRKTLVRDVRLAVIVPARQQEATISQTVQSLLHAGCSEAFSRRIDRTSGASWEIPIIVAAYECTDHTGAVAAGSGARVVAIHDEQPGGRERAIRLAIEAAEGWGANAVLVVDSTSKFTPNLVAATRAAFAAGATATQSRIEFLPAATEAAHIVGRFRAFVFRGNTTMGVRGRAGLGFSAGLLRDGFGLASATLKAVPFVENQPGGIDEYHRKLLAAGVSVKWIDHAVTCWNNDGEDSESEGGDDFKTAISAFRSIFHSYAHLLYALTRGRWRAFEPLIRSLSVPFWMGGALLLTLLRTSSNWGQIFAVFSALLFTIFFVEDLILGASVHRNLRVLGLAVARRTQSSGPNENTSPPIPKNALLDGVRREMRLP